MVSFLSWIILVPVLTLVHEVAASTWAEWWTYDGISGPEFWGSVNLEWRLCRKGRKQSPIDVQTNNLLYDPNLKHLHVSKHRVNGAFVNTGHDIRVILDDVAEHNANISGGPLQYSYRISEIVIRFGSDNSRGSEHAIDGHFFPAEIQIMGWNSDIYGNMTQALYSPSGLVVIALLAKIADTPNAEFEVIAKDLNLIKYKGKQASVRRLSVHGIMPETHEYITYEGSLSFPACHETVTWIIPNKHVYVSEEHLRSLRQIMVGTSEEVRQPMQNNFRPIMPLNHRQLRTNINFTNASKSCTMERRTYYEANVLERR